MSQQHQEHGQSTSLNNNGTSVSDGRKHGARDDSLSFSSPSTTTSPAQPWWGEGRTEGGGGGGDDNLTRRTEAQYPDEEVQPETAVLHEDMLRLIHVLEDEVAILQRRLHEKEQQQQEMMTMMMTTRRSAGGGAGGGGIMDDEFNMTSEEEVLAAIEDLQAARQVMEQYEADRRRLIEEKAREQEKIDALKAWAGWTEQELEAIIQNQQQQQIQDGVGEVDAPSSSYTTAAAVLLPSAPLATTVSATPLTTTNFESTTLLDLSLSSLPLPPPRPPDLVHEISTLQDEKRRLQETVTKREEKQKLLELELARLREEHAHETDKLRRRVLDLDEELLKEMGHAQESTALLAVAQDEKKTLLRRTLDLEEDYRNLELEKGRVVQEYQALLAEVQASRSSIGDVQETLAKMSRVAAAIDVMEDDEEDEEKKKKKEEEEGEEEPGDHPGREERKEKKKKTMTTTTTVSLRALEEQLGDARREKEEMEEELKGLIDKLEAATKRATEEEEGKGRTSLSILADISALSQPLGQEVEEEMVRRRCQQQQQQQQQEEEGKPMLSAGASFVLSSSPAQRRKRRSSSSSSSAISSGNVTEEKKIIRRLSCLWDDFQAAEEENAQRLLITFSKLIHERDLRARVEEDVQRLQTRLGEIDTAMKQRGASLERELSIAREERLTVVTQRDSAKIELAQLRAKMDNERTEAQTKIWGLEREVQRLQILTKPQQEEEGGGGQQGATTIASVSVSSSTGAPTSAMTPFTPLYYSTRRASLGSPPAMSESFGPSHENVRAAAAGAADDGHIPQQQQQQKEEGPTSSALLARCQWLDGELTSARQQKAEVEHQLQEKALVVSELQKEMQAKVQERVEMGKEMERLKAEVRVLEDRAAAATAAATAAALASSTDEKEEGEEGRRQQQQEVEDQRRIIQQLEQAKAELEERLWKADERTTWLHAEFIMARDGRERALERLRELEAGREGEGGEGGRREGPTTTTSAAASAVDDLMSATSSPFHDTTAHKRLDYGFQTGEELETGTPPHHTPTAPFSSSSSLLSTGRKKRTASKRTPAEMASLLESARACRDPDVQYMRQLGDDVFDVLTVAAEAAAVEHQSEKEAMLDEFILQLEAMKERAQVAMEVQKEKMRRQCHVLLKCQAWVFRAARCMKDVKEGGREGREGEKEEGQGSLLTLKEAFQRWKRRS